MKDAIVYPKFLGDGKRVIFIATASGHRRVYLMALDTGEIKPALPESVMGGFAVSPDGKSVAARGAPDSAGKIYDLAGGLPHVINGIQQSEWVVAWGNRPLPMYVGAREGSVVNLFRLDPVTGQRQFWRRLMPSDPAGVRMVGDIYIAPDAQAYGYSYYRLLSQLYVAEGLH